MAMAGWEVHYYPAATVIHIGGQSADQIPVETYVRRRMAQLQFMQKHGSAGHARIAKQFMRLNLALRARRAQGEDKAYYERMRTRFEEQVRDGG
jgi:GT2 family glycosyltransferase